MIEKIFAKFKGKTTRGNALMRILVRYERGAWVFTDESRDLEDEPFVAGIAEILTAYADDMGISKKERRMGVFVTFSGRTFPGAAVHLKRGKRQHGGRWYKDAASGREGWLCPALFKYFREAPKELHASLQVPA